MHNFDFKDSVFLQNACCHVFLRSAFFIFTEVEIADQVSVNDFVYKRYGYEALKILRDNDKLGVQE